MVKYLLTFLTITISSVALACDCHLGSPTEKLEISDSVFIGKVVDIVYKGTKNSQNEPEVIVTFKQTKRFKGKDSEVVLDTNINGSSCTGYWFKKKQTMLVYAMYMKEKLDVMWCGGVVIKEESPEQFQLELSELEGVLKSAL